MAVAREGQGVADCAPRAELCSHGCSPASCHFTVTPKKAACGQPGCLICRRMGMVFLCAFAAAVSKPASGLLGPTSSVLLPADRQPSGCDWQRAATATNAFAGCRRSLHVAFINMDGEAGKRAE
eukprot:71845-Prymnesium_polylepis.1